jgi:glycosyltransferase involved in cell wall biosynthesis
VKIGLYLKESNPERGGSYTFESQILREFLILSCQSRHKFTVLENGCQDLLTTSIKNGVYLKELKINTRSSDLHLAFFLVKRAKQIIPWLGKIHNAIRAREQEKTARKLGLNLIWSIVPGRYAKNVPYITTVFDLQHRLQPFFPEVSRGSEWESRENSIRPLVRKAAMLITGTQVGKSEIELFYNVPSERIRVIPFPTPLFKSQDKDIDSSWVCKKYDLPNNYLFYPAQFWPHKNHANLLLAISQLKQQFNLTVPIVFVGANKGNLDYLQKLISQYDLSAQVRILGFVSQSDLEALYKKAIALTFVSFFGPDNLPPLEAFSLGCPVIAANVPGAQEQLGDAAKLVDPKNADQIALAIKAFWEDADLRQTYIKKGYERANQWSAQDYVQEVFKIFDELEPILNCWQA